MSVYSRLRLTLADLEEEIFPKPLDSRTNELSKSIENFGNQHGYENDSFWPHIGLDLYKSSKWIATVTLVNPRTVAQKLAPHSTVKGKVVIAYHCCEGCGEWYHTNAIPNALYQKWKDYPVEFVICVPKEDKMRDEFVQYLTESIPNWKFALIEVDQQEYGTGEMPYISVIDKNSRI